MPFSLLRASVATALLLAGCGLPRPVAPGTTTAPLRAQARVEALRLLVNNQPAADYMSARHNETWTVAVAGPTPARVRWQTDARLIGAPDQPSVRVNFPWGPNLYVIRCVATLADGQTLEREVRVLMPAPAPSMPPNPLPPLPVPLPKP